MAFFKRVMDHLLNEVLVEGLANSKWFQRFAVWSHGKLQDINATAKDPSAVAEATVKAAQAQKESWAKFREEVTQEMRKMQGKGVDKTPDKS